MKKWKELTPAEKDAREATTRRRGNRALAAGFVLVAISLGFTLWDLHGGPKDPCEASRDSAPSVPTSIFAKQTDVNLNGTLCLGVKVEAFFAAEHAEFNAAKAAVESAKDEFAKALTDTDKKGAQAKIEAAQKRLDAALLARPASKKVTLFFDEAKTPVSLDLYVVDPKTGKDGWTWNKLTLIAPTDADSDAGKLWRQILAGTPYPGVRAVKLGLGDSDAKLPRPHAIAGTTIELRVYEPKPLFTGMLGLALVAGGLVALGWYNALLRDTTSGEIREAPFSLARVQFAWWFFLAFGGFLFIWLVTGQFVGVMTTGVLTLMGISGVSGLAARTIDALPTPAPAAGAAAPAAGAAAPAAGAAAGAAPGAVAAEPAAPRTSDGFLRDILSDGGSIGLHRVQMAAWTLVLGAIFLWTVTWSLTFPTFDNNLLLLAGIVNGLYLGFKFPEK